MQSLWMLLASFLFSLMGVCIKLASATYTTSEIVLFRSIIGVCMLGGFSLMKRLPLRTPLPGMHLRRGLIGVTALWLWFFSIGRLPLATAMTLNYLSPIWIAAILFGSAWIARSTRFEWRLVAAILASFVGVTLLLRPVIAGSLWFPSTVGLCSGVLAALAYLQVRELGLMGEPEYRVVFYFSLTGVVAGGLASLVDHGSGQHAPWQHDFGDRNSWLIIAIGVLATLAQVAMTRAYRLGNTLLTANLQYTGIVFSTGFGIALFADRHDWMSACGITLILLSGIAATFHTRRAAEVPAASANLSKLNTGDLS